MQSRIVLILRIALGAVFCYGAYTKLRQPWLAFALSVDSYQILPSWAVFATARTLPWLELLIGVLLLTPLVNYAAIAASAMLAVFTALLVRAYAAGGGIDCGCFGLGEAVTPLTLTRDSLLLLSALALTVLVWRRRRAVSQ